MDDAHALFYEWTLQHKSQMSGTNFEDRKVRFALEILENSFNHLSQVSALCQGYALVTKH